jgi:hypothetical protein
MYEEVIFCLLTNNFTIDWPNYVFGRMYQLGI